MFTGIITDLGHVIAITHRGDRRFTIATRYHTDQIAEGASIACNGVCLTVIERGPDSFVVDVSAETLSKTTLGAWTEGTPVNLERSLRLGDELGGHLVFGHVDATAAVLSRWPEGDSQRFLFELAPEFMKFVAPKGSVALDGVSLTVNEVEGTRFGVNIIPHTQHHTNFGTLMPGQRVNLEIDMLARYVARQMEVR